MHVHLKASRNPSNPFLHSPKSNCRQSLPKDPIPSKNSIALSSKSVRIKILSLPTIMNTKRGQFNMMWEHAISGRSKMGSEMVEASSITTMAATTKDTGKTTKCMAKGASTIPMAASLMMAAGTWTTSMAKARSITTALVVSPSLSTSRSWEVY